MPTTLLNILRSILHLFFPKRCALCGAVLPQGIDGICLHCRQRIPRTHMERQTDSAIEQLFWGKMPIERATAFSYYRKGDDFCQLIHDLKYHGRKDLGFLLGQLMASELQEADFFKDIDVLIPVPLHPRKEKQRGYNQSYCIAAGIASVTGLPIESQLLKRSRYTETQTHKSADARWNNVSGVFALEHPEKLAHRHILLIDDVLTTGATLTACADAFATVKDLRISIATLGWASR